MVIAMERSQHELAVVRLALTLAHFMRRTGKFHDVDTAEFSLCPVLIYRWGLSFGIGVITNFNGSTDEEYLKSL